MSARGGDESVVQALAGLPPRVRQLHFPSRGVTAIGAAAIGAAIGDSGVHTLGLERNQLGDEGALALAAAIPGAAALTTLALGDNHIGADGLEALLQALESSRVRVLDLGNSLLDGRRHNRFRAGGTAVRALARYVASSQLTQLILRGCGLNQCCEEPCVGAASKNFIATMPLPRRLCLDCSVSHLHYHEQAGVCATG